MELEISFTKEEMIELLQDHLNTVYEIYPPKSIFDDMSQFIPDFVNGYFKGHFQPERLNPETSYNEDVIV